MRKIILALFLAIFAAVHPTTGHAQQGISVYVDAEIHSWLQDMARPLLMAAEISPSEVNVYVAKNKEINAFATSNRDIVLFSGLILEADSEDEVRGVLAHEIGHIKAQHFVKSRVKQSKETLPSIIGAVLGVGAAVAGSPDAAQGLILGGVGASQSSVLKHSRTHEWEADKIAIELLDKSESNAEGFANFFLKLRQQQMFYSRTPPAYLLTHPVSSARMEAAMAAVEKLRPLPPAADNTQFKRIQSKISALGDDPKKTLRILGLDESQNALYGRSIALALLGKTREAISEAKKLDGWMTDAFFNELIAFLYLDIGDLETAQIHFNAAYELAPRNPLIQFNTARNLIDLGKYDEAIQILRPLLLQEPRWSAVYHQLGLAYGKQGELFSSHLFLAEEAILKRDNKLAKQHITLAKKSQEQMDTPALNKKLKQLEEALEISVK